MLVELSNKPLVEAIFEIRWQLEPATDAAGGKDAGILLDKHYKLLPGALFGKLGTKYPYPEELQPISQLPDELTPYQVRQRFRTSKNEWPLFQVGPGVATLNDTNCYSWESFKKRALELSSALIQDAYPEGLPPLKSLMLRYIDSTVPDDGKATLASFVKDKLKFDFNIDQSVFGKAGVHSEPLQFEFRSVYEPIDVPGKLHFRIGTGKRTGSETHTLEVFWESMLMSEEADILKYNSDDRVEAWLNDAHKVLHDWFFAQIDGELLRRFQ